MSQPIRPRDLLREAEALRDELQTAGINIGELVQKIQKLGTKFRTAQRQGGLHLTEPDYHRAARIYVEQLLTEYIIEHLGFEDSTPILYNHNLAE